MEQFKKINNFDMYEVSNFGNIRSIKNNIILKPQISSNGHYIVTLFNDTIKKGRSFQIHQLVAMSFLDIPSECVNHKDGIKTNNNIENLEYVTFSENLKHAHANNLRKKIQSKNKNNTSGTVGVIYDKHKKKWVARLHKNRKAIHIGSFKNKEDAVKARKLAEDNINLYK